MTVGKKFLLVNELTEIQASITKIETHLDQFSKCQALDIMDHLDIIRNHLAEVHRKIVNGKL